MAKLHRDAVVKVNWMQLFTTFILSLFLTIGLVPVFKRMAFRMHLMDEPDARKVHVMPMPRSGGISMAIGAFLPVLIWVPMDNLIRAIHMGCAIIVVFGIMDDVKNLRYSQKLFAQVAAALVVIFLGDVSIKYLDPCLPGGVELPFFVSLPLTLLFIVGVTNAINLSDGLDGLAGGISMLSFVAIGLFAYKCGDVIIATMSFAVAGAILGFLRYNTHPAVVFMGDAGSQMLGFLCVVFAIVLTQSNTPYSQVTPIFLIGFPILDTLTVMAERIVKGGSPFKADKNHFHHKLMKLGLYHSESVLVIYFLQALFIGCGFVMRFYSCAVNLAVFILLAGSIIAGFGVIRAKKIRFRVKDSRVPRSLSVMAIIGGERLSIRVLFMLMRWTLFVLLLFQCIISVDTPVYMSWFSLCMLALVVLGRKIKPEYKKGVLRAAVYCMIPLVIFFSVSNAQPWVTHRIMQANNFFFIVLVLLVVGTLNLTRRKKGFKMNPLDFLVFIVIFIFPNIPSVNLESPEVKMVVAKVLILFFSVDVLLGELRRKDTFLDNSMIVIFAAIAVKGFI